MKKKVKKIKNVKYNLCGGERLRGRDKNYQSNSCARSGVGIYFFGFIGAAVFYIQNAVGFWDGFVGILKAIVWPAFLIYKLFGM